MVNNRHNKQRTRYLIWLLLPFVLLLSPLFGFGQEQHSSSANQNEDDTDCILILRSDLAIVQVQVKTLTGLPVTALMHTDFAVYEDGIKQTVAFFIEDESGIGTYTIGYYPTNDDQDGTFRKIRVRVSGSKEQGWKVRFTPKNYFAPID